MFARKLLPFLLLGLVNMVGCGHEPSIDPAMISDLESRIKLQDIRGWGTSNWDEKGLDPKHQDRSLGDYARFYARSNAHVHPIIIGTFVIAESAPHRPAGIYIVGKPVDLPLPFDGGCNVVHVIYQIDIKEIVELNCEGNG